MGQRRGRYPSPGVVFIFNQDGAYQSTVYLALHHGTEGRVFTHQQARAAALAYGVVTLVALPASVPVRHAMGLL